MEVSTELVQKIASYLSTCPYRDVAVMINELQRQSGQQPEKPKPESEEPDGEGHSN